MPSVSVPKLPSAKSDASTFWFCREKPNVESSTVFELSVQVCPTVNCFTAVSPLPAPSTPR